MLAHLRIQNIALIEDVSLDLQEGLVILTGETGAGKSILLDGIHLGLGGRVSKELLTGGNEASQVDLLFTGLSAKTRSLLAEDGIDTDDDELLITRRIMPNARSTIRVNGQITSTQQIKAIASTLLDIYGQSEHQSLLNTSTHRDILDRSDERIMKILEAYQSDYDQYQTLVQNLDRLLADEKDRTRLLSLMEYEKDEIEQAEFKEGEEETLRAERSLMYHMEHLKQGLSEAIACLSSDGASDTASSLVERAVSALEPVESYDEEVLKPVIESLNDTEAVLEDLVHTLYTYFDNLNFDPERLKEIEDRLALIRRLKDKYGNSISEIQRYLEDLNVRYDQLSHIEETRQRTQKKLNEVKSRMEKQAKALHDVRVQAADILSGHITESLKTLQFNDPEFTVRLSPMSDFGPYGTDQIEFMIRTNVGSPLAPLARVASGGEMSRIMLAIKTELADQDEIPTMIFDEIDTGISGRTAQRVAEKMAQISRYHQVMCVTHLPQIAAMADQHYQIEKLSDTVSTKTLIHELDRDGMILELMRLSGGMKVTDTLRMHAEEMKQQAEALKLSLQGDSV